MKNTILMITISLIGFGALAKTSNQELIQSKVLGKLFCYSDKNSGWFFSKDGVAVRMGYNLGVPGPNNYYKITFSETPRTYGLFDLSNNFLKISFQIDQSFDLYEYSSGKILSTKFCK